MKKYLSAIPVVLLLCFVVGCQDKAAMAELEQFKAQAAEEEANLVLARQYYDAWNSGDLDKLRTILSHDFVWHTTEGKDVPLDATLEDFTQQVALFTDRTVNLEDLIAKGNKVVIRYLAGATFADDAEGIPTKGKKVESKGVEILRIENGKILESWEEINMLSIFQQLGFELKPKEAGK